MDSKNYGFEKLNNSNYYSWKYKMRLYLIKEELFDVIGESVPDPETVGARVSLRWIKRDQKAQALIGLAVEDSQLVYIRNLNSASEIWQTLKSVHEKDTLTNRISLYKRIAMLKLKEDEKSIKVQEHINEFIKLFQQLDDLNAELKEDWKIGMLLASLPTSYSTLVTALEARKAEDLSWIMVQSKIMDESLRQEELKKIDEQTIEKVLTISKGKRLLCYFCKKDTHEMKNCFKFKKYQELEESKRKQQNITDKLNTLEIDENETDYVLAITTNEIEQKTTIQIYNEIITSKLDENDLKNEVEKLSKLYEELKKRGEKLSEIMKSVLLINMLSDSYSKIEKNDYTDYNEIVCKILKKNKKKLKRKRRKELRML